MRLFDGHPECHSFPHEHGGGLGKLGEGLPAGASAKEAWGKLHDPALSGWFKKGYPITQRKNSDEKARIRMRLLVAPGLQKRIFMESYPEEFDERAAYGAYNTSYFNAWIDNQNLYGPAKKWVVFFQPRAVLSNAGSRYMDRFSALYPEGRIISIVREPQSWFASAQGWAVKEIQKNRDSRAGKPSVVSAMDAWTSGVSELLQIRNENPELMAIVQFSDLLGDTPGMMGALTEWLGIGTAPRCLFPTFNGLPVVPNTSFKIESTGVVKDPLKRAEGLAEPDRQQIERLTGDLMDQVAKHSLPPVGKEKPRGR
jgi:hypothetical protein